MTIEIVYQVRRSLQCKYPGGGNRCDVLRTTYPAPMEFYATKELAEHKAEELNTALGVLGVTELVEYRVEGHIVHGD